MSNITNCRAECSSKVCSSCAAGVIYDAMDQVKTHRETLKVQKDFQAAKEIIQKDMINFIDKITQECDKIFVKKIINGNISKCEQEKLNIHREIK